MFGIELFSHSKLNPINFISYVFWSSDFTLSTRTRMNFLRCSWVENHGWRFHQLLLHRRLFVSLFDIFFLDNFFRFDISFSTFSFYVFPSCFYSPFSPFNVFLFNVFRPAYERRNIYSVIPYFMFSRCCLMIFVCGRSVAFLWYCWFESDFYTCFFVKLIVYFIICSSIQSTNGQL